MRISVLCFYSCNYILFSCFTLFAIAELRPSSDLHARCYDFPKSDFGYKNNIRLAHGASPHIVIAAGKQAIDFTLPSENGVDNIHLGTLLKNNPVVLLFGHYTCPAYQGYQNDVSFGGSSWQDEQTLVTNVWKHATVVHIVGPEPHPMWPYTNYDSGGIRMNLWSTIPQPQTFEERMELSVNAVRPYMHPKALLVVDYLDGVGGASNNPVWCSYAQGARSAIVIAKSGQVKFTQTWFNEPELTDYILNQMGDESDEEREEQKGRV